MATLFNTTFRYVELSTGGYDESGVYSHGTVTKDYLVHGSAQAATYKEQIPAITGTRNTGNLDVYSSDRLACRMRGGNDGGYVIKDGIVYQLISEQHYHHLSRLEHWKYVAELVPADEVPEAVSGIVEAA